MTAIHVPSEPTRVTHHTILSLAADIREGRTVTIGVDLIPAIAAAAADPNSPVHVEAREIVAAKPRDFPMTREMQSI